MTTTEHSFWQKTAAMRYPKMLYMGGDGDGGECWVVLTKCRHQQTRHWRYWLAPNQDRAEAIKAKLDSDKCTYTCTSEHSIWRLQPC